MTTLDQSGIDGGGDRETRSAPTGVRSEHTLRVALKEMTVRHDRMLRVAHAAHRYAYGRRETGDLRDLRRALASVGLAAPEPPPQDHDA